MDSFDLRQEISQKNVANSVKKPTSFLINQIRNRK